MALYSQKTQWHSWDGCYTWEHKQKVTIIRKKRMTAQKVFRQQTAAFASPVSLSEMYSWNLELLVLDALRDLMVQTIWTSRKLQQEQYLNCTGNVPEAGTKSIHNAIKKNALRLFKRKKNETKMIQHFWVKRNGHWSWWRYWCSRSLEVVDRWMSVVKFL